MTTISLHTVNCDATLVDSEVERSDDCQWWIGQKATAAEARRVAKEAGWKIDPKGKGPDYCPACRPDRRGDG